MNKVLIKRQKYLDKIKPFIDKDLIKVLVGQRRIGKSYLLLQIIELIKNLYKNPHIIYINKEKFEFDDITDYKTLLTYVKKNSKKNQKNYLFIDEIQDINEFEKALRSLKAEGNYDIYCTGSNANLLSGELATYLSGRYIEIPIYGLDYSEFLIFHQLSDTEESFFKYIKYGGLPYLMHLPLEDEIVFDYLNNVYDSILLKDVVARYNIRNVSFLENLVQYIADNLGSLVSAKKVSDFLKNQKINISVNVVIDYLSHLYQTFLIYKVPRMNIEGKKIFEINEKYYFEDLGIRNTIIGYRPNDIHKIMENLVFMHLKNHGYQVFIGKMGKKEIDFIAEKNSEKVYIQVAYKIHEDNLDREFGNLLEIKDNYPKIVVSADDFIGNSSYKGIKHLHIRNFIKTFS